MRKAKSSAGIVERHARTCTKDPCTCENGPSYMAWVWDRRAEKKLYKTFSGKGAKSAAKLWRGDAIPQVRVGTRRATTPLTLRQAWATWIEQAEKGEVLSRFRRPYKPSALRGYRADMDRYVLDDLGAVKLVDLSGDDLQALVERLNGQGLSGSKVRNVLIPLQALYRRHRRQVPVDPTSDLDLPAIGEGRDRVAQVSETAALLGGLPEDIAPIYATAAYAGLRRGELRALRVSDVNSTYIWVDRSWDDVAGVIDPKSKAGRRHVPLPATLAAILTAYVKRTGRPGDALIFGRTATEPFTPSHVRRTADAPFGLHELRHSYASYLDQAGVPETRQRRYLGHALGDVTERYRHQLDGQLADDAKRLDKYLTGAKSGKVVPITGAQTGAQGRKAAAGAKQT